MLLEGSIPRTPLWSQVLGGIKQPVGAPVLPWRAAGEKVHCSALPATVLCAQLEGTGK